MKYAAVHVVPFKAPPFPLSPPSFLPYSLSLPFRFCVVCLRLVTFVLDSELNEDIIRLKNQAERCGAGAAEENPRGRGRQARKEKERLIENRTQ